MFANTLILPFAYNNIGHPSQVTERRIKKAFEMTAGRGGKKFCALTAGYSKRSPRRPCPERAISLADQMATYVWTSCPHAGVGFETRPLGWGTLSEIYWSVEIALWHFGLHSSTEVIMVSSIDHLPRVKKYAKWILPRNWRAEYHSIDHRLNEAGKERIKFLKDLPFLFWVRIGLPVALNPELFRPVY